MDFLKDNDHIYLNNDEGQMIAEAAWVNNSDGSRNLWHTFVDDSLRGQGIAGKLMEAFAADLRETGKKGVLTCSYAVSWFAKHPEYADLLRDADAEKEKAAEAAAAGEGKACALKPNAE